MEDETSRIPARTILLLAVLFVFLAAGCPKTQETASPTAEEKKEPPEIAKPEQVPLQAPAQPVEKPAPPTPAAGQHPVASGETLLDPAVPRDARMIQSRLAELGFYKAKIDGIWGRMSRAALKSFKEKNALGDPERWDKETQVLLFRDTGK